MKHFIDERNGFGALIAVFLILVAMPTQSLAQSTPACGPLVLDLRADTAEYLDLGLEGPTQHDQRNGRHTLLNEAGDKVGDLFFYSVFVMSEDGDGYSFYKSADFRLDGGSIYATGVYGHFDHTTKAIPIEGYVIAVIGGTGKYRGARGELVTEPRPNKILRHTFEIECLGPSG